MIKDRGRGRQGAGHGETEKEGKRKGEKEISLEDFAAKQKTTVEELRRINKKELPAVLKQNDLIDVPFAN